MGRKISWHKRWHSPYVQTNRAPRYSHFSNGYDRRNGTSHFESLWKVVWFLNTLGLFSMSYHSGNQLIDPHLIFEKAHLQKGMHVADLGCGKTGHLVFPGSLVIGESGVMYAVDIMKEVLEIVDKRARVENLLNVHTVWSNIERLGGTAIPSGTLDIVFIINSLWHSKKNEDVLNEAARLLRQKGRIVVVDWKHRGLCFAPKEEDLVNFEAIKEWARIHAFAVQEDFESGKYHRGIVLFRHN